MRQNIYELEGKVFHSVKALADYSGVNEKTITARLRRGLSVEKACENIDFRCSYHVCENNEKSVSQICREQSKDADLVRNRLHYGYTLEDALNNPKKISKQGMPVIVRGKEYKSISEAIRSLKLSHKENTIRSRLRIGMEINQAFNFPD